MRNKCLLLVVCISCLFQINPTFADTNVEADQENGGYRITGELILDESFSGSEESQKQAATCQGCSWVVTPSCFLKNESTGVAMCSQEGLICQRADGTDGNAMKVWRKLGFDEPWLLLGVVCIGPKGPVTPETLTTTIQEQSVEYLPRLLPTTNPGRDVLVNTEIYFNSNQSKYLGPKVITVAGIPVTLTAVAVWTWKFEENSSLTTGNTGGNFPEGIIRHVYETKGLKTVIVTTTWDATWSTKSKKEVSVPGNSLTQTTSFNLIAHEARGVLTR